MDKPHSALSKEDRQRVSAGIKEVIKAAEISSDRNPLVALLTLLYAGATLAASLPMPRAKLHLLVDAAIDHSYPMVEEMLRKRMGGGLHGPKKRRSRLQRR